MIWLAISVGAVIVLFAIRRLVARRPVVGARAEEDDEVEITLVRAVPLELLAKKPASATAAEAPAPAPAAPAAEPIEAAGEPDEDVDPEDVDLPPRVSTTTPFYPDDEPDAAVDEPTQPITRFLVSACGQTDQGRKRRRNEDSLLMADAKGLFVVADGMGGYAGGKVASEIAVSTVREIFEAEELAGPIDASVPRRGAELAWAVQKANAAIFERAQADAALAQMGTTVVAARFSPDKQRVYIAHVGDSRAYRFRDGVLRRLTTDHTMESLGFSGKGSEQLYRAVGIAATIDVDLVIDKPRADDAYLFCSDGLTKMASDEDIATVIAENVDDAEAAAYSLIEIANDRGGKDNVTCIFVKVVERVPDVQRAAEHTVDVQ